MAHKTLMPEIYQGNDIAWSLYFTDSNGDPIDITDSTITFLLKRTYNDDDIDAKILKNITTHINPTGGESQLVLTNVETTIDSGTYFAEFQYTNAAGEITTLASTFMTVLEKIKD